MAVTISRDEGISSAAALAFLLCDICHLFKDEVNYIWPMRMNLTKAMYLLARYYGLMTVIALIIIRAIENPTVKLCDSCILNTRIMQMAGTWVSLLILDVICTVRLYALYARSRKVLFSLIALSLLELAASFFSIYAASDYSRLKVNPPSELSSRFGCQLILPQLSKKQCDIHMLAWLFTLINAMTFFALTLFKFKDSLKDEEGVVQYSTFKKRTYISPLLLVFMRDGSYTLLLHAAVIITTMTVCLHREGLYFPPAWPWLYASFSYVGSRLIINLRRASARGVTTTSETAASSGSGRFEQIEFASRGKS
ncbi:hypothetical protein D9611_010093 [Ephemerocybe angulata]|uniref:DUF6533 domain-containing protein n=1 Tax=Ephemerocybe angulata TaxID=980116 RepID=A0A8H5EV55_9AGAR|nr:hypothetical protein D9611_010093 [Tulosesus angulatus]